MTTIHGIDHHGKEKPYPGKEDDLQAACMNYLRHQYPQALAFHCPNGGSRNRIEAAKLKGMGVLAGVCDIVMLEKSVTNPNQIEFTVCHCLLIELKAKGGTLRQSQFEFLLAAQERGYKVAVCWSFDAFKALVDRYLNGQKH